MRRRTLLTAAVVAPATLATACAGSRGSPSAVRTSSRTLPAPASTSTQSFTQVLAARRSLRDFSDRELTRDEVAQLLWSAQGVTSPDGYRTAPSAGALYPLTLYVALPDGVHRYHPDGHRAERMTGVDLRQDLAKTALSESPALAAPALFVVTATVSITAAKYDGLAERYVLLEAGHATQNLLLMAVALGLGGVPLGALDDEATREVLDLPGEDRVIYLVPVGPPPSD